MRTEGLTMLSSEEIFTQIEDDAKDVIRQYYDKRKNRDLDFKEYVTTHIVIFATINIGHEEFMELVSKRGIGPDILVGVTVYEYTSQDLQDYRGKIYSFHWRDLKPGETSDIAEERFYSQIKAFVDKINSPEWRQGIVTAGETK